MNLMNDSPIIETRGLTRRFQSGDKQITVLDDVTLSVARGEFVAIMGKSGSGKSTLLALLAGLDRPSAGVPCGSRATRVRRAAPSLPLGGSLRFGVGNDSAVAQPNHAIGLGGQVEVVRDDDDRRSRFTIQRLEECDDSRARFAVEISRRLVGEENARRVRERAGNRDALLFAAGELRGEVVETIAQSDAGEQVAGANARAGVAAKLEGNLHVLERGEGRDQLKALKDEPNFLAAQLGSFVFVHRREIGAVENHLAA